ncbi:ROK family protein [Synergistales bacterium]|nr:ROK family protein [Synergistales bacterium]
MSRIGIDLGGHTITAALVAISSGAPEITRASERATPTGRNLRDTINIIADMVSEMEDGSDTELSGIGVGVPAMLGRDRKRALGLPNFPDEWTNVDIAEELACALSSRCIKSSVKTENDANCYALGEGTAGAAAGLSDYVVFTMGTGIGCGIVIGGKLLTGAHGMAGECGHIVVNGDLPCGCGGRGHAETISAADGTSARAIREGLPGDFKSLWSMIGTPQAGRVINATIDGMARTIATISHTLDPQAIVIGGGMSRAPGLVEAIRLASMKYLAKPYREQLDLRVSALGEKAALFGAASI